jgi:hypothetical protein
VFAPIKPIKRPEGDLSGQGYDLKPLGRTGDPSPDGFWRSRAPQFIRDGFRDEHFGVKAGQSFDVADKDEIVQRGSIGNDDAQHGSQAEPKVSLAVLLQILPGVFQPDLVLFQESIQFVARFKPQETPELGSGKLALAVSLEGNGFECGTREILVAGSRQSSGELVG